MNTTPAFYGFELIDYTPALDQLSKEVLLASLSRCIVCCRKASCGRSWVSRTVEQT